MRRHQQLVVWKSLQSTAMWTHATKCYYSLFALTSLRLLTAPTVENSEKRKRRFNASSSSSSRLVTTLNVQFSGSTLTPEWGRKFILGVLLQSPALSEWLVQQSNNGSNNNNINVTDHNGKTNYTEQEGNDEKSLEEERRHLTTLLPHLQHVYGESWNMSPLVLDNVSTRNIYKILAQYALGEGMLLDDVLRDLNCVLEAIPYLPRHVEYPQNMLRLLEILKYVAPHDNLQRIRYEGKLRYPAQAEALALPFLESSQLETNDHADSFDAIREMREGPAYAIDSATTSEVDDAIGVEEVEEYVEEEEEEELLSKQNMSVKAEVRKEELVKHKDKDSNMNVIESVSLTIEPKCVNSHYNNSRYKNEDKVRRKRTRLIFTVYVSDATVYCPLTSPLEQITARLLCTTTYLPEGVYFMLPKPIVEAATLQEARKCRTFNIRFSVDEITGEVTQYSVHVGWLKQLRRLTYEQVQGVIHPIKQQQEEEEEKQEQEEKESQSSKDEVIINDSSSSVESKLPSWVTQTDVEKLQRIYKIAQLRFKTRMERAEREINRFNQQQQLLSSLNDGNNKNDQNDDNDDASVNSMNRPITSKLIDINLPDPYIRVEQCKVITLRDQIIATAEARLLVAELMIAANEVCSRVAQENRLPLPYRGTRELSTDHEVSEYDREPIGVCTLPSIDSSYVFFAESMQLSLRRLRGVTRAIYSATPLFHSGLQTFHYCHATSPLRRYADMLVHHQLKAYIMKRECAKMKVAHLPTRVNKSHSVKEPLDKSDQRDPSEFDYDNDYNNNSNNSNIMDSSMEDYGKHAPLPEYIVAALCANINTRQEESKRLQDNSIFYWQLRYVEQLLEQILESISNTDKSNQLHTTRSANSRNCNKLIFTCLVGETREVHASPVYDRFTNCASCYSSSKVNEPKQEQCHYSEYEANSAAIRLNDQHNNNISNDSNKEKENAIPFSGRWTQPIHEYRYVSDLYIPQLQLAHTLLHNTSEVKVGMIVECAVRHVLPAQGVLELEIVHVRRNEDERRYRDLYMGGVVSSLDT